MAEETQLIKNLETLTKQWYYDKNTVNEMVDNKSDLNHDHDSTYYTKSEIDMKLLNLVSVLNDVLGA